MLLPLLVALTYADDRRFSPVVASVFAGMIRDNDNNVLNKSVTLKSSLAEHSRTLALWERQQNEGNLHTIYIFGIRKYFLVEPQML